MASKSCRFAEYADPHRQQDASRGSAYEIHDKCFLEVKFPNAVHNAIEIILNLLRAQVKFTPDFARWRGAARLP